MPFLFLVQLFGYSLQFVHKFFLEAFGTGVVIDNALLQDFEVVLEGSDELVSKGFFGLSLLDAGDEHFEVSCQHFKQILLILLILPKGKFKSLLLLRKLVEIGKGVDPLEALAALDSELVSGLQKLSFDQLDIEGLEEVLALGEDVSLLVVVGNSLVEEITLGAVVHALHDLLLAV